jgi:serine protease
MSRNLLFPVLTGALLVLAACSDLREPLVPESLPAALAQLSPGLAQQAERVVPGRVLARLEDGSDAATVGGAYGLELDRVAAGYVMFRGAAQGNERALAARMQGDGQVVWAEPDYLRQKTIDWRLWAFYNPGGLVMTFTQGPNKGGPVTSFSSVADADEDNVEDLAAGGSPVSIASIDTGVDFGHAEFVGGATLVAGYDYYSNDADPTDQDGHGTHTTGTMVGLNVGVAGVAGAARNVTVYVYRVCGPPGCPTSAIVDAIYAATDADVVAMNISIGGGSLSQSEADAIRYATDNDALVIVSAGNSDSNTISCPACDPNAISVAASNWQDELTYYSNRGPGLDLTAPGGQMYSNTSPEGGIYSSVPGGYAYYQGTSMAAPQVTGTAAIVASMTGLTGADLRSRLEGTADDLGSPGYDTEFGNGRLNSYRAVTGTTLNEGGSGGGGGNDGSPSTLAASFAYSCSGLTCLFDGSGSTGSPTSYEWEFGLNGATDTGMVVSHAFTAAGNFVVTLTVGDGTDVDSTSQTVRCKQRGPNGIVCS